MVRPLTVKRMRYEALLGRSSVGVVDLDIDPSPASTTLKGWSFELTTETPVTVMLPVA